VRIRVCVRIVCVCVCDGGCVCEVCVKGVCV